MPSPDLTRTAAYLKSLALGESLRRNPAFYRGAWRMFDALEAAPLEPRRQQVEARLRQVLRSASRMPYGRRVGAGEQIADWPLLESASVRDDPAAFRSGSRFWNVPAATGGTTGVPVRLVRSPRSIAIEQASIDRLLRASGIEPARAHVAVLRGDNVKPVDDRKPPFWTFTQGGRRMVMSSNHLNAASVADYAKALREFGADYWWLYPTSLEALCRLTAEQGIALRAPLVLTSSEVLSPAVRELATRTLGSAVLDYYGQAERVCFAYSLSPGEYRFLPGYGFVELVAREVETEHELFEIVGTPLWNPAMALVRYRTGDLIRLPRGTGAAEREALCLGLQTFAGVLGRDADILIAPDGTRLTGIDHFQRGVDRVARIQVIQESLDRVRILVLPRPGYRGDDRDALLRNIRAKLPSTMRVEIEQVTELERTPLGKTPFVIRRPAAGPKAPQAPKVASA